MVRARSPRPPASQAIAVLMALLLAGGLVAGSLAASPHAAALAAQDSQGSAPGSAVVGDAPEIHTDRTDYAMLAVLATCLIGAGVLLVSVERWERRRSAAAIAHSPRPDSRR